MLTRINIALHGAVFLALVLFSGYGLIDFLFIITSLAATCVGGHIALRKAQSRKENARGVLLIGITLFFWAAYTIKLAIALVAVKNFWVVPKLIDSEQLFAALPEAYAVASLGYLSLLVSILAFPVTYHIDWTIRENRARPITTLLVAGTGLLVKYMLKSYFLLGIPGVDPISMGIPFLAGAVTLAIGFSFLFLVNIPVFLALVSGRRGYLALALVIAFANGGIDLRFGSKNTILFEIALVPIYLSILYQGIYSGRRQFIKTARLLIIGVGSFGLMILAAYKYMNFFRFALLLDTKDVAQAIALAAANDNAQSRSSLMDIINRLTGIEALGAVMHLTQQIQMPGSLIAFIDGSVVRHFTQVVLGSVEAKTLFSMTQFGYFYVGGGLGAVVLGSLVVGFVFAFIQYFTFRSFPVHHNMKLAFLPILWLSFVLLLLGGGNLVLWSKDMLVTLVLFFIISRISVRYEKPSASRQNPGGAAFAARRR